MMLLVFVFPPLSPQSTQGSHSPQEDRQEAGTSRGQAGKDPELCGPGGHPAPAAQHNQEEGPEEDTPSISSMYLPGKH